MSSTTEPTETKVDIAEAAKPAATVTNYRVTRLEPLPGADLSYARAISERGLIVGFSADAQQITTAVSWEGGQVSAVPGLLGWTNTQATAVNRRGDVVGYGNSPLPNAGVRSFLASAKQVTDLGTVPGAVWYRAQGVNRDRVVVGYYYDSGSTPKPFRWSAGQMSALDVGGADTAGVASEINSSGQVVGVVSTSTGPSESVASWSAGVLTTLGAPTGWLRAKGKAINDNGLIVGDGLTNSATYLAFTLTSSGFTFLNPPTWSPNVYANGVNGKGDVVGSYISGNDRAVLWQAGQPIDLQSRVPLDDPNRFLLDNAAAWGINDRGEIVGFSQNARLAFLLTPEGTAGRGKP